MKFISSSIQAHKRDWFFLSVTLGMVIFPFFLVRYMPVTDLPQHLCQIKLFIEHFSHTQSAQAYTMNWSGANSLVYIVLGINWILFPPLVAGKAIMLELAISWVLAVFLLAKQQHRPIESAVVASILVFNASFYWGFINFLFGFPVFVAWYIFVVNQHEERRAVQQIGIVFLLSLLFFFAHAIWLIVGIIYLGVGALKRHRPMREFILYGIALFPILVYSLFWYRGFSAMRASLRFDIAPHWFVQPLDRLNPLWLIDAILGGIHGPLEILILLGIGLWCFFSLYTNRGNLRNSINFDFLLTGVFFTIIVFFAPDKFMNTIYFASRWMPVATTFFLLALPLPKTPSIIRTAIPLLIITVYFCTTGLIWYEFEKYENTGLTEALDAIPEQANVLGLDFIKTSIVICGRPYLQTFAYAQVLHGSKINFSFAEHQNGIITTNAAQSWSPGLEWMAELVKREDFEAFDYAIINAPKGLHNYFSSLPLLKPVTKEGRWRLYRCDHNIHLKGYLLDDN